MKKSILVVLAVMSLALFSLPGNVQADSTDPRSFVLSNELGPGNQGGLIDRLIAAGYGSQNLYQILQLLAAQPGTGIPADFVASVGNNPAGCDVFTAALSNFAGLNSPVGINADGSLKIVSIFGRDYDGHTGYVTNEVHYPGIALSNFTMATSFVYYIDAGEATGAPFPNYLAIGIAWERSVRTFMLSNEAPGYLIDKLIAAGHGSENLYQVLQFLAAQPGSGIPSDFVTEVGNNQPGSEVFTAALSNFSSVFNNPIGINADGTLIVAQILGRDYDGHTGFVTNTVQYSGVGPAKITNATNPQYYIDAGTLVSSGVTTFYKAFAIAWAGAAAPPSAATPVPTLNEWGMILLSLAMGVAALFYMKRRQRDAD
jgi:hypothetical protein